MAHDDITSAEGRLLASMLESHGRQLNRIDDTLGRVADVIENLGRLEERVVAVQDRQEEDRRQRSDHETRLKVVEVEMPSLKEIRRWVIGGVLATVGLMGTGIVNGSIVLKVLGH